MGFSVQLRVWILVFRTRAGVGTRYSSYTDQAILAPHTVAKTARYRLIRPEEDERSNIGLEPTVSRVTLLARERKLRATRPAAQPGRYADRN